MDGNDKDITLILVGETNVQGRQRPAEAFRHVLPVLKSADVLFGHLEAPLTMPSDDPTLPDIPHKKGWRHSGPDTVKALSAAGFAAVSLASNVMYGRRAAVDTVQVLDGAGIVHCGAGRNLGEARRPAVVQFRDVRFGFLSYTSVFWPVGHAAGPGTPGVATVKAHTAYQPGPRALEMPGAPPIVVTWADPEELQAMEKDIRALSDQVDVVVVSIHWGLSGSHQVIDYQREIGRVAIQAGADLVMGHHPHRLQGIEIVEGQPVLYSMGNFAFDWHKMKGRNLEGILVKCRVRDRTLHSVAFVPVRRNQENLVEPLSPSQGPGKAIVDQVRALSSAYGTRLTVADGEVIVQGNQDYV
jgi:poly-gamma-glutamate synthesis protein (capsule biosynthesis protein)